MGSQQTIILVVALKCLALSYAIQFTLQSHVAEWGFRFGLGMNSILTSIISLNPGIAPVLPPITFRVYFICGFGCSWKFYTENLIHLEPIKFEEQRSTGMSLSSKVTWPQLAWQPPENRKKNSREVHSYFAQKCHNNSWDARHFFCKLENHSHSCKQGEILQLQIAMCYH